MGQKMDVESNITNSKPRKVYRTPEKIRFKPEDVSPNNGYVLDETYIPEEVLALILSYLDKKSLGRLRFVCLKWCEIIRDHVWKIKAEREFSHRLSKKTLRRWPSEVYQAICCMDPYGRNLIKNDSGLYGLRHWRIRMEGGDRWKVEKPPVGVKAIDQSPENFNPKSCFVTSYQPCSKDQKIDLYKEGIHPDILDVYRPPIIISEWYSARWDCCSHYELTVSLLNYDNREVKKFEFEVRMADWLEGWKQVTHRFEEYDAGVQYVVFSHAGRDYQFWAGHYGSKMANASVIVDLQNMQEANCKKTDEKHEMDEFFPLD